MHCPQVALAGGPERFWRMAWGPSCAAHDYHTLTSQKSKLSRQAFCRGILQERALVAEDRGASAARQSWSSKPTFAPPFCLTSFFVARFAFAIRSCPGIDVSGMQRGLVGELGLDNRNT